MPPPPGYPDIGGSKPVQGSQANGVHQGAAPPGYPNVHGGHGGAVTQPPPAPAGYHGSAPQYAGVADNAGAHHNVHPVNTHPQSEPPLFADDKICVDVACLIAGIVGFPWTLCCVCPYFCSRAADTPRRR